MEYKDFKNTEGYQILKKEYLFKAESLNKIRKNKKTGYILRLELSELVEIYKYNYKGAATALIWTENLLFFANKHKKSLILFYKYLKNEMGSENYIDNELKRREVSIIDLLSNEGWAKDEVLEVLAIAFLHEITYLLFEYSEENEKLYKQLESELEQEERSEDSEKDSYLSNARRAERETWTS